MKIPEQLRDCKFCKINKGSKVPFEKNWQNKDYSYDLISMYFPDYNYGVLTGINSLGVLDDDSENKVLMKIFEDNFKDTFRVRNHYYIKLKNWDGKKIIFYDEDKKHLGELQGKGQQVVGPGSLHPSGEFYELKSNIPIIEIEYKKFKKVFSKYLKKEVKKEDLIESKNWEGEDINKISISSVLYPGNAISRGSTCQGSHPIHGSNTGANFVINNSDNTWYCFRCNTGGGIWTAIAVSEGLIDCSDCNSYNLSPSERKEVIKIANLNYGLKFPENEKEKRIKQIKETCKTKLEQYLCPKCKKELFYNGKFVDCKGCGYFKSLKKYFLEDNRRKFVEKQIIKPLKHKAITKTVEGTGINHAWISAWYDHDNEENRL